MKLISSIATIIERGKARWYITTHSLWSLVVGPWSLVVGPWSLVVGPWSLVVGPWCCLLSRHKSQDINKDMSQDVTPLQVKSSDELKRSTK